MKTRHSGMVLITTIIMMVILSLLILSLMQQLFLYIKINNQVMIKHGVMQHLEAAAQQLVLAKNTKAPQDCMGTARDLNQRVHLLLEHRGCTFTDDSRQYYYFIDDLGQFPCVLIVVGDVSYSSRHWLISMASSQSPQAILQLRVAEPTVVSECETSKERIIREGLISWRYLPAPLRDNGISSN